jgi:hypothetical protein
MFKNAYSVKRICRMFLKIARFDLVIRFMKKALKLKKSQGF